MKTTFNEIIEVVLEHEGGYVNDPDDAGGETKYGIAKRWYPNVDIKNLTKEVASPKVMSVLSSPLTSTTDVVSVTVSSALNIPIMPTTTRVTNRAFILFFIRILLIISRLLLPYIVSYIETILLLHFCCSSEPT